MLTAPEMFMFIGSTLTIVIVLGLMKDDWWPYASLFLRWVGWLLWATILFCALWVVKCVYYLLSPRQ